MHSKNTLCPLDRFKCHLCICTLDLYDPKTISLVYVSDGDMWKFNETKCETYAHSLSNKSAYVSQYIANVQCAHVKWDEMCSKLTKILQLTDTEHRVQAHCIYIHLLLVTIFFHSNLHGSNLTFSKFESICMFEWCNTLSTKEIEKIGDRGRCLPTKSLSMGSSCNGNKNNNDTLFNDSNRI